MRQLSLVSVFFAFLLGVSGGLVAPVYAQGAAPAPAALDPNLCAVPKPATAPADKKSQRRARSYLETAHEAYQKGDFASTLAALQEAYAVDPSVDILYNMAQSCRAAGLLAQALPLYEEVLRHNPSPEQQQVCNAKLAELRPQLAETDDRQAEQALTDKRYDQAVAGFQQAYTLSPKPAYLFHLAEAQRLAGHDADAVATYQRLLTEAPTSPNAAEARQQLGLLKAQQADVEAKAHYDKGEYLQAVLGWDAAYRESSRSIFLFRKADAMRQTGQRKEAAAAYEQYLKLGSLVDQPELRDEATRWAKELRLPVKGQEKPKPLYTRWWFWTSVVGGAAVAAGVAAGVAVGTRSNGPFSDVPSQNIRPVTP